MSSERETVLFVPRNYVESGFDFYHAIDGWRIERLSGVLTFCASDPGLSAKDIRIPIEKESLEYAQKCNPTFNEMLGHIKLQGTTWTINLFMYYRKGRSSVRLIGK